MYAHKPGEAKLQELTISAVFELDSKALSGDISTYEMLVRPDPNKGFANAVCHLDGLAGLSGAYPLFIKETQLHSAMSGEVTLEIELQAYRRAEEDTWDLPPELEQELREEVWNTIPEDTPNRGWAVNLAVAAAQFGARYGYSRGYRKAQ
jgi:hypothetical protein